MKRLLIKEIEGDEKQFGDDRRTVIEEAEKAVIEFKIVDEAVTVIISQKGWVRARTGHGHDTGQFTFKAGDACTAHSNAAPSTTCWRSAPTAASTVSASAPCRMRAAMVCRSPRWWN